MRLQGGAGFGAIQKPGYEGEDVDLDDTSDSSDSDDGAEDTIEDQYVFPFLLTSLSSQIQIHMPTCSLDTNHNLPFRVSWSGTIGA